MYEHVLLQVLDPGEAHSAGWALERSVGAIGTRPLCAARGRSQVQLVRILDILQSNKDNKSIRLAYKDPRDRRFVSVRVIGLMVCEHPEQRGHQYWTPAMSAARVLHLPLLTVLTGFYLWVGALCSHYPALHPSYTGYEGGR